MARTAAFGRTFLILIAAVTWLSVVVQIILTAGTISNAGRTWIDGLIQALSYFTVLTNLIVAVVATASVRGGSETFLGRPSAHAAVAVYIFIVGVIYALFLKSTWEPTGLQLALDVALHELTPVLFVLYWLLFVPKEALRWREPVVWLIYPLAYFAYSFLYGVLTGRYLYPFSDVGTLGYPKVIANGILILLAFLIVGLVAVAIGRVVGGRGAPAHD